MSRFWTADRVELLKAAWSAGRSGTEIADLLGQGVTRSKVLGKINRLGLSGQVTNEERITRCIRGGVAAMERRRQQTDQISLR